MDKKVPWYFTGLLVLFGTESVKGEAELFQYNKSDFTEHFDFIIQGTSDFEI